MKKLTNEEFRIVIKDWQKLAKIHNVTLPNGRPLPDKFYHVVLGVGYSTFKKMLSGKDSIRTIQNYTYKTVYYINLTETEKFISILRFNIDEYVELYKK